MSLPSWASAVFGICSVALLSPPLAAEEKVTQTVLVLDVKPIGVAAEEAAVVTEKLAAQVSRRAAYQVLTQADLQGLVETEQTKQLLGCDAEEACLVTLSELANTDLALACSLGQLGRQRMLNATLVNTRSASVVGRSSMALQSLEDVDQVLPALLAEAFQWSADVEDLTFALPEGQQLSFAVLDLEASGVPEETARNLTQVLSTSIKRIDGTSVISRDDIVAMLQLEQDKALLGCEDDTACVAEIGGALGVDKLVLGQVGKLAGSYVISLRLIDTQQVKVDHRVSETFRGAKDQLLIAVQHSARRLLGVHSDKQGQLAVTCATQQVEVFVDSR